MLLKWILKKISYILIWRASAKMKFWLLCYFFRILLLWIIIGFLWMCFRRNLLNFLLCFLFSCFMLCNLIRLYASASRFILSLFLSFRLLFLFLCWIVLLIFQIILLHLFFLRIHLYIHSFSIFLLHCFLYFLIHYFMIVLCVYDDAQHLFRALQFLQAS